MEAENTRRNDRISLDVPIQVSGMDEEGRAFVDDTWTCQLSRHGATIFLNRILVPHQEVNIRCIGSQKAGDARVLGLISKESEGYNYGIEFLDLGVNLWDIEFPPLSASEEAVARVLLECARCHTQEVVYLNELEAEVFEVNQCLSRACKRCTGMSLWKKSSGREASAQAQIPAPAPPAPEPVKDGRRQSRVGLKLTACVCHVQIGEEIVTTEDVSKGGFSFKSAKHYAEGWRVEVAVPYSPGPGNIFVPAVIAHIKHLTQEGMNCYGVSYVPVRKKDRGS